MGSWISDFSWTHTHRDTLSYYQQFFLYLHRSYETSYLQQPISWALIEKSVRNYPFMTHDGHWTRYGYAMVPTNKMTMTKEGQEQATLAQVQTATDTQPNEEGRDGWMLTGNQQRQPEPTNSTDSVTLSTGHRLVPTWLSCKKIDRT